RTRGEGGGGGTVGGGTTAFPQSRSGGRPRWPGRRPRHVDEALRSLGLGGNCRGGSACRRTGKGADPHGRPGGGEKCRCARRGGGLAPDRNHGLDRPCRKRGPGGGGGAGPSRRATTRPAPSRGVGRRPPERPSL